MHLPHLLDETLAGIGAVEFIKHVVDVIPRPVHPEITDGKGLVLEHLDETCGMIVIGMWQDDVCDLGGLRKMLLHMGDDLIASIREAAVDDVDIKRPVFSLAPFNNNCITVAVTGTPKI